MFIVFSVAVLLPFSLNTKTVLAQDDNYSIQHVDHQVEVLYSGQMVIRDTIHLSGQLTGDFSIGFPHKYASYVLKGIAYDDNKVYPVSLGVQLADRSGFYAAKVSFPQGAPQVFTVVFILSNSLLTQDATNSLQFSLDFPAYPSFTKVVATCNVNLVFPGAVGTINVTKDDGNVETTNFAKENLPAFAFFPAKATFALASDTLQEMNIKEIIRRVEINPLGEIKVSERYRITNNSTESFSFFEIGLPNDASTISVKDEFGRILTTSPLTSSSTTHFLNVTFVSLLSSGDSTRLSAEYSLPTVSSAQTNRFTLNFALFPDFNYYVDEVTVTFIPPEGARFVSPQLSSVDSSSSLVRDIFQETLTISGEGVSYIDNVVPSADVLQIAYDYNPLWLSFRPTMWMWTLAVVGSVFLIVWRRPKASAPLRVAAPKAFVGLGPEQVRTFTEAYSERNRIALELKSLEARAQKGKIPRRRYKVQRRTLEVRADTLSKSIGELKKTFRSAGGIYADLIRQLDLAEVEIEEVEANIRTIEVRHGRGELPLEAYKRQLADYQRRIEKAEATINGILLRLREEIQ
jgi:hypothetical protein